MRLFKRLRFTIRFPEIIRGLRDLELRNPANFDQTFDELWPKMHPMLQALKFLTGRKMDKVIDEICAIGQNLYETGNNRSKFIAGIRKIEDQIKFLLALADLVNENVSGKHYEKIRQVIDRVREWLFYLSSSASQA